MTISEKICNEIASKFFLNEFTYKELYFLNGAVKEELCDGLIECGDAYLVVQVKERDGGTSTDEKWLESKVYKKAVSQIKKSIEAIKSGKGTTVYDMYDQEVVVDSKFDILPVIVFFNDNISEYCRVWVSSTGLKINVFNGTDYRKMMDTLKVPVDILDYLGYRTNLLGKAKSLPTFIIDDQEDCARIGRIANEQDFAQFFAMREFDKTNETEIAIENFLFILRNFRERMTFGKFCKDYKEVLKKLIIMKRRAIKEFIARWLDISKNKVLKTPVYDRFMIFQRSDGETYGFLFIKSKRGIKEDNMNFYSFLIELFSQKFKINTVVLFISYKDTAEGFDYYIETIYSEKEYKPDEEIIKILAKADPWQHGKAV